MMRAAVILILIVAAIGGCFAIGGRRVGAVPAPSSGIPATPADIETMDQQGLLNAIASLKAEVEAVGVKITTTTYDSWSMRMLIGGMVGLFGVVVRERNRAGTSQAALGRVIRHLEVYRDQEGVAQVIGMLKSKNDKIEKHLNQCVKRETT